MRKKYIKMVMGQVANMFINNFTQDYVGGESLMGWLADGEVWEGESEEDIQQALAFAEKVAPLIDGVSHIVEEEG